MRILGSILWPSFMVGAAAEVCFFVLFDPIELHLIGNLLGVGRIAAYSVSFFLFWMFAAASSAFTCFMLRSA